MGREKSGDKYDLVVIGAGVAGNAVARAAGKKGWRTALVERDRLGGTCLNVGCDPTKAMLHCAEIMHQAREGRNWGLDIPEVRVDFARLMEHVHGLIAEIRGDEPDGGLADDGVELVRENGKFLDAHRLQAGKRVLEGKRFLIATGSAPIVPDIPGLKDAPTYTNETVFGLRELPGRILVLGGGPVGCEFAQMLQRFGAEVCLADRMPRLLQPAEPEIARALADRLGEEGVELLLDAQLQRVTLQDGDWQGEFDTPSGTQAIPFDAILLSIGRRPKIGALDPQAAGVDIGKQGVRVDEKMRTNVKHIWAAGDVTGGRHFTHAAGEEASLLIDNLLKGKDRRIEMEPFPWGVYTDPEIAHVGLSEEDAEELGIRTRCASLPVAGVTRARLRRDRHGLCKMVADASDGRLIGAELFCPHAGELIHEVAVAIRGRLSAADLASTIHAYPTMAQVLRSLARRLADDGE